MRYNEVNELILKSTKMIDLRGTKPHLMYDIAILTIYQLHLEQYIFFTINCILRNSSKRCACINYCYVGL